MQFGGEDRPAACGRRRRRRRQLVAHPRGLAEEATDGLDPSAHVLERAARVDRRGEGRDPRLDVGRERPGQPPGVLLRLAQEEPRLVELERTHDPSRLVERFPILFACGRDEEENAANGGRIGPVRGDRRGAAEDKDRHRKDEKADAARTKQRPS